MPSNNIGSLLYESTLSDKTRSELQRLKNQAISMGDMSMLARIKTFEESLSDQIIYIDQFAKPVCKIHEPPSFFVNRSTYQLTDSGNKYEMVACINTNMLDILVMKCIEEIRPISRKFTLLKIDCDYLNVPFENGLEVFDSNKANWIKL